jgi:hypothetical protein
VIEGEDEQGMPHVVTLVFQSLTVSDSGKSDK